MNSHYAFTDRSFLGISSHVEVLDGGKGLRWHPVKWFNPAGFTPSAHRVFPFRLSWKCIKTKSVLSLKYSEAEPKSFLGLARGSQGKVGFLWLFPGQQREFYSFPWLRVQLCQQPGQGRIDVWGSSFLKGWSIPSPENSGICINPKLSCLLHGKFQQNFVCVAWEKPPSHLEASPDSQIKQKNALSVLWCSAFLK